MAPVISSQMTLKRIQREIADVAKEDLGQITLVPTPDNLFVWKGSIPGPQGSPYEGGVFGVDLVLASDYPFSAPKLTFSTRIYHMNISEKGNICIDILKHNWSPALSLFKVMLSLSSLLTDPNPLDPLVPTIATEFIRNRAQHDKTARQWTEMYAKPPPPRPLSSAPAPTPAAASSSTSTSAAPLPTNGATATKGKAKAKTNASSWDAISANPRSRPSGSRSTSSQLIGNETITIDDDVDFDVEVSASTSTSRSVPVRPSTKNGKGKKRKRDTLDLGDDDVVDLTDEDGGEGRNKRRASGARAGGSGMGMVTGNGDVIVIDD